MLFVRDFIGFTGGHLKFAHYLEHTAASGIARPVLYQTPRSRIVPGNIFNDLDCPTTDELRPFPAYFVAGLDWLRLDEAGIDAGAAPVVNLIQDSRFADPQHPLFACLARPALRICVSPDLADAIRDHANGDVLAITNCIEIKPVPTSRPLTAPARIFVAGLKNPKLARDLTALIGGQAEVDLITDLLPHPAFLARMAIATVCVLLPGPYEGFFLPPLEAMALGRGVVTSDCGFNRTYCQAGDNCLMPASTAEALAAAALSLTHDRARLERLAAAGLKTASEHTIDRERAAYHAILANYLGQS